MHSVEERKTLIIKGYEYLKKMHEISAPAQAKRLSWSERTHYNIIQGKRNVKEAELEEFFAAFPELDRDMIRSAVEEAKNSTEPVMGDYAQQLIKTQQELIAVLRERNALRDEVAVLRAENERLKEKLEG